MSPFLTSSGRAVLKRKCRCGGTPGPTGECEECQKKRLSTQRSVLTPASGLPPERLFIPPIVPEALRSPGQPLDSQTRAFMEPRFGHDFSKVRVHTDKKAVESAKHVNARAFTRGHDIVFGANQHQPSAHRIPAPANADAGLQPQRRSLRQAVVNQASVVPPIVHEVLRSPGHSLDDNTRTFMESFLGHDFSRVRVHTDSRAAASARAVNAHAYTVGHGVVFGAARYAPTTSAAQRLLAHELTHVVQQRGAIAKPETLLVASAGAAEREADQIADTVASSERHPAQKTLPQVTTATTLARQSDGKEKQEYALPVQTPALAEREREVEALEVNGKSYVLYQTEVRSEGSSSWLANNPGNLDYTADTAQWGAYENKKLKWGLHRFAIFPNEETGLKAVRSFLRKHQTTRDIRLMMNMFAPAGDLANKPSQYAQSVATRLGVPVTTLVKDLSDEQIETFAVEIQRVEGWKPGTVNRRGDPDLPKEVRER
jgi:hypothetical protein